MIIISKESVVAIAVPVQQYEYSTEQYRSVVATAAVMHYTVLYSAAEILYDALTASCYCLAHITRENPECCE